MTRGEQVEDWVRRYVAAWGSNDEADVRGLFTDQAEYRYHPWDEPVTGSDAIAADWLESRDEPGSWTFDWTVIAVDGSRGVVEGRTVYTQEGTTYRNLWVIELEEDGRASRFTEWFMTEPAATPPSA